MLGVSVNKFTVMEQMNKKIEDHGKGKELKLDFKNLDMKTNCHDTFKG